MKNYNFRLVYKKYDRKKTIIKNITTIILLALFAAIVMLYANGSLKIFSIRGWSAEPYHLYGALAVDYKVPFETLEVGDFITWSSSGGNSFTTHQIVKLNKDEETGKTISVITCQRSYKEDGTPKSPAELLADESVNKDGNIYEEKYYGKVLFSIPNVGLYMTDIKSMVIDNGALNIIGIVTIILIGLAYYLFTKCLNIETYVLMGR